MIKVSSTANGIKVGIISFFLMSGLLFPAKIMTAPTLPLSTTLQVGDAVKYITAQEDFNYFVSLVSRERGVRYRHITYINKEYNLGVILGLRYKYEKDDLIRIAKTNDIDLEIVEKEARSQFIDQVSNSRKYQGNLSFSKESGGSKLLKGSTPNDEFFVVHPCPNSNSVPPGLWSYYFRKDVSGNYWLEYFN